MMCSNNQTTNFIVGLATVIAMLVTKANSQQWYCDRIQAAFTHGQYMHLIVRDTVIQIDVKGECTIVFSTRNLRFPYEITAAVNYGSNELTIFSGIKQQDYLITEDTIYQKSFYPFVDYTELFNTINSANFHGIDAAVRFRENNRDRILFFYGCYHVFVNTEEVSDISLPQPNSLIELPCDIDAAFRTPDYDEILVIKGDQIWMYNEGMEAFLGPVPVADFFRVVTEWYHLCPNI